MNIAVELNNINIVKLLLSLQGINPLLYSKGRKTPLITAFEKGNYYIANLIFDFYGDNVLQKTWQLNEILKKFISSVMFNFSLSFANPEVDGYTVFKRFLQFKNIDLNYQINNQTLFTHACDIGNKEIISFLVNLEGCDVNFYDTEKGDTALLIAVNRNRFEIAEILIKSPRVNINHNNFNGETALTRAVESNLTRIIDLIVNNEKFDPKESRLDYAFSISHRETTKHLISVKGLNVNYKIFSDYELDSCGTALTNACKYNNFEEADMIINHPSFDPVKSEIKLAIILAAENNAIEIFNKLFPLINNDVNIHSKNESLLVAAARGNSKEIIHQILNNPAFDLSNSGIDEAFYELLRYHRSPPMLDVISELHEIDQKHSCLIDFNKALGNVLRIFYSSIDAFKCILDHVTDLDLLDSYGYFPLQNSILYSNINFIDCLIGSGKVNITRKVQYDGVTTTYLHLAARANDCNILKKIISLNIFDINVTDSNGGTPLIYAIKRHLRSNICVLFEKDNLDFGHINNLGEDAIDVASKKIESHFIVEKLASKNSYLKTLLSFI